jgi:hypothetical protein
MSKKLNKNINLGTVHFIGLYCIIILQCMVQKTLDIVIVLYFHLISVVFGLLEWTFFGHD